MKFCIDKYPMGSWKGQKSPGKYMDKWLHQNLELLAEKIVNDMTFLGIIYSSTLEVGTGKSVFATQIGEAWTEIIKQKHGIDLSYDINNIVWRPKDLIERSFQLPKYSFILLDEWEDSTYWSELGITLRQFFRKCRQLNLFMICIIPNWFQLPLSYAVSRSVFAIDVQFNNEMDRGYFSFYNFPAKRKLYINGKRQHNYYVTKPTFKGYFPDGYGVDEEEYRKMKYDDMIKYENDNPERLTKGQIEANKSIQIMNNILEKNPNLTTKELAGMFGVGEETIRRYKRGDVGTTATSQHNYNKENKKEIIVNEEKLEKMEEERTKEYNEEE